MGLRSDTGSLHSYEIVEATGTNVAVPDATLMFTGAYSRVGSDLVLTGSDGAKFVATGYFTTDTPPALVSPEGAMLTSDVVTSLAGPQFPGQYAQAGGGAGQGAESIGKVQTLEGGATVVRTNGVTETLKVGDPVFQGDVVMTGPGAKLGISFLDGTLFSLTNNARMVLNKLVYEPNGSDNSMLFNLVEGTFVFAAGKIAPTGDMKVQTPVATMGIRGTTPTVDINASSGAVNMSIVPDLGTNIVGSYTLYNLVTGEEIGTISAVGKIWRLESANGEFTEIDKGPDDLLKDAEALSQLNSVFASWSNNQSQNPEGPQAGPNNSGSGGFNSNPDPGSIDGAPSSGDGGESQQQNNDTNNESNNQSGPPPIDSDEDDGVNEPPTIVGDLEVTVSEGGTVSISPSDVSGNDPDSSPTELVYTVIDAPDFGQLEFTNNPGVAITTFTQADLDAGRVIYVHDGSNVTSDSYTLLLSDGEGTSEIVTVNVTIDPVNQPPGITGDLGITVDEGGTVTVTTNDLDETDPDDDGFDLVYTITDQPDNGQLELTTNPGVAITSFTQADLDAGRVVYVHDGSETTTDSYEVSLADGGEDGSTPATATIDVTITPVNEPPGITGDLAITVDEAGTVTLTTGDLNETDPDDDGAGLVYTITDQPDHGQLELSNNPGAAITSFTQADLDAGLVVYVHDGSETTTDSYEVSLADGGEDGSTPATATIDVTINPVVDVINGDENPNLLNGTISDDIINGFGERDTIFGSTGNDDIDGGEDEDTVDYSGISTQDIIINLVDGTVSGNDVGFDTVASIERFVTGGGNDTLIFAEDSGFFFDGRDGVDTVQFAGGVDVDTETTSIEVENIEILDLKSDTESNVLTLTADDVAEANDDSVLQIRGGSEDVVNLTNEFLGGFDFPPIAVESVQLSEAVFDGSFFLLGTWVKSDQTFEDEDGTVFDVYEFFLFGLDSTDPVPVATAQIEQGVEVNIPAPGAQLESFESGFGPNDWETINAVISTTNATDGQSSARISTNSITNGGTQNAAAIALLTGVSEDDLDALADDNAGPGNVTDGGAIVTNFSGVAGQVVSFDWFFSTQDYPNFNDIAFVTLNGEAYKLFDVIASGNQSGDTTTEGWNQFSIVLEDSGDFKIGFGVLDDADQIVSTDLFIDNLELEPVVPGLPVILGGEGNDILIGSDADEIFVGGNGNNTLTGNGGEDVFVIAELNGIDTITDFTEDDSLDLTGLLDGAFDPDNDDINEFVRATTDENGNTTVAVDVDGADGPAEFADVAILQGVAAGVAVAVNIGDDSEAVTSNAAVAV